jgi:malate/lactate dehydrogenase
MSRDIQEAFPKKEIIPLKGYTVPFPVDYTFFTFSTLKWSSNIGVNDRWIESKSNIQIIDQIASESHPSSLGEIFVVSNPVDIITQYTADKLNGSRVFGVGISIDEKRNARVVKVLFDIDRERIPCIGEHGLNVVPLLSQVMPLSRITSDTYERVRSEAFKFTEPIIKHTSIPLYGPMAELDRILKNLADRNSGTISVSVPLKGKPLGVSGVALGVPVELKEGKLGSIGEINVNEMEHEMFLEAARKCEINFKKLTR